MLRLVRIPVLVALLLAAGPLLKQYSLLRMRLNQEGMVASLGPWILLVVIAAVFVVLVLAHRDGRHGTWLLTGEIVVSAIIVLVPPLVWLQVTGRNLFSDAMGASTGAVYAQVLAIAWLVVAVRTLRTQRRRARAADEVVSR